MTVTPISTKRSRVTPDEGKLLRMQNDEQLYSEIVCLTKMVKKISEVDEE